MKKLSKNDNGYVYNILIFIIGLASSLLVASLFLLLHSALFPKTEMALIILPLITGLPIGIITGYLIVDKLIFNSTENNISIYIFEGIIFVILTVFVTLIFVMSFSFLPPRFSELTILGLINFISLLIHKSFFKYRLFDRPD